MRVEALGTLGAQVLVYLFFMLIQFIHKFRKSRSNLYIYIYIYIYIESFFVWGGGGRGGGAL